MAFDRPTADQMIRDVGAEAFCRLATYFVEETGHEIEAIEALAVQSPKGATLKELGRRGHSLKNAAGSFGLAEIAQAARALEAAGDSSNGREAVRLALSLRVVCESSLPKLRAFIEETKARSGLQG